VKDGSGALYCFGPKAKTIKAGTHSLTRSGEEERQCGCRDTPRTGGKGWVYGIGIGRNSARCARLGIGDKKACLACENFIILQSEFII